MPAELHDAVSGRRAATIVDAAIGMLRRDLGTTVLVEALTEIAVRMPPEERDNFWLGFEMLLNLQKQTKGVA